MPQKIDLFTPEHRDIIEDLMVTISEFGNPETKPTIKVIA